MAKKQSSKKGSKRKNRFEVEYNIQEYSCDTLSKSVSNFHIKSPHKLNEKQRNIMEKMVDSTSKIVMVDGRWGTGKSYLAVLAALKLYQSESADKIYYIRTPCESTNTSKLGYLPGDVESKTAMFNIVMLEKLDEFLDSAVSKRLVDEKAVEFLAPAFIRGRNLTNCVMICDEASNFSFEDILLLVTRMGENCKMFLVGDSFQNDIGKKSGFIKFFDLMNDDESRGHGIYNFTMADKNDIVRSGIIKYVMEKAGIIK